VRFGFEHNIEDFVMLRTAASLMKGFQLLAVVSYGK
jgi:hypothetical protein